MATRQNRRGQARPRPRRRSRRAPRARAGWPILLGMVVAIIVLWTCLTYASFDVPSRAHLPLTAAQARASNAAVPFVARPLLPARRFVFHGGPAAREQATECLATAALYEAGTNRRNQKAVIQVILNRVRLPGFPKTVCGVVYQGAGRATGCQFSFTCDGSLARRTEHVGWQQARASARRALDGHVFAAVGRASHYHADWMVPYWRASLDKIAKVDTHIFYVRR
uniref:cell wall hydrolase n=1 Tax=uncultured Sphingomonas sp. TaxID=158754 RepID=UPI0035CA4E1A